MLCRFNRSDLVVLRPMTDWKPQWYIPEFQTMWCARVIKFLKFVVRTEVPNAKGSMDETLECAYLHFLSRYNPPVGECDHLHESRGNLMMYAAGSPLLGVVGKLPVVPAEKTGRIPFAMRGRRMKDHCYPEGRCDDASDTNGSNLYFVNHHALTCSRMHKSE